MRMQIPDSTNRRLRNPSFCAVATDGLRFLVVSLFMVYFLSSTAYAQPFDVDYFLVEEQQLGQWVFGSTRAENSLEHAENALQVQIEWIATIGTLTEMQRRKLELAGRVDIRRFFDEFETLKQASPTGRVRRPEYEKMWQNAQPLQFRFQEGLHANESLFRRAVRSVLDKEQFAKFQELENQRNRRHYRAYVKATVALIEDRIPLTSEKRSRLIDLVVETTEPPKLYGQIPYQYHVVLFQMSRIPEDELKPIFMENEWKVMQGILRQCREPDYRIRRLAIF
jgi:hypothetical protein